jgi:hypothetical protein
VGDRFASSESECEWGIDVTSDSPAAPASWYPDPVGRHQFRYWDGVQWTDWVADDGVQSSDPLVPPAPASAAASGKARPAARSDDRTDADRSTRRGYLLIGADGYANTEVAGEFARMDAIHAAIGRKPRRDEEIEQTDLLAALVPEPTNRYDMNAVMVQIAGQHVGYLEKEDAARYLPVVREVWDAGYVAATGARIWASARGDWESPRKLKYVARVSLALGEPHLLLPVNDPPTQQYSILPWGPALQAVGEELHQSWLARYITPQGDGIALATVAEIAGGSARTPKALIEIRLDGERVGQLSPASSQHFIPTVRHLESQGMATAAWVRIRGNAIASQATLHAMKAHELPADWFEEPTTIPSLRTAST